MIIAFQFLGEWLGKAWYMAWYMKVVGKKLKAYRIGVEMGDLLEVGFVIAFWIDQELRKIADDLNQVLVVTILESVLSLLNFE